jgi:hypothetical protein
MVKERSKILGDAQVIKVYCFETLIDKWKNSQNINAELPEKSN